MNGDAATLVPSTPQLDHLMRVTVHVDPPLLVGRVPLGERREINITGGHFTGEKLHGEVLSGGADWQLVRADGAAILEAKYTLRTHDGALLSEQVASDLDLPFTDCATVLD